MFQGFPLLEVAKSAVVPAAVASAAGLALALLGRRAAAWAPGVALAAGYLAGSALIDGIPAIPPAEALHRLPFLVLGTLALFAADDAIRFRSVPRLLLRLLCLAAVVSLLSLPLGGSWTAAETAVRLGGPTAAGLGVWTLLDRWAGGRSAPGVVLPLLVAATGGSIANLLANSARLAQLGGALASALGGIGLVAVLLPGRPLGRAATAVALVLLLSHLVYGTLYYLPFASAAILLACPLAAALSGPRSAGRPRFRSLLAAGLAAAIPAAAAAWIARPPAYDY